MDETEYQKVFDILNPMPCVYEKALFTTLYHCEFSSKNNIGERESLNCQNLKQHKICHAFLNRLQTNCRFVIKLTHPIPHAKNLKIQCGGLYAATVILNESAPFHNRSASTIINEFLAQYSLEQLPYQQMLPIIAQYNARKMR